MSIIIKQPIRENGISVDINVSGGNNEIRKIKDAIDSAISGVNVNYKSQGFVLSVYIFPLNGAFINGTRIGGQFEVQQGLNEVLGDMIEKPDDTKGRNLNPEPRNIKGAPRILTKHNPTENLEE